MSARPRYQPSSGGIEKVASSVSRHCPEDEHSQAGGQQQGRSSRWAVLSLGTREVDPERPPD
jgi:hypothetical protein